MEPIRFDTKIAIALDAELPTWQKLNVTAFLISGVAAGELAAIGEPYRDANGNEYLAMFGQPVLIYAASRDELIAAHRRALERDLRCAIFTEGLFATGNDRDNRAQVAARAADALDLVGIALRAPRSITDRVLGKLKLHP